MAITPTYPGVYIQEIPSAVRTITGVATSITAFIGRAKRGPVNEPITINNFGDFERIFGGLWVDDSLGYAVRDFYLNGGSQAIVVRLFHDAGRAVADAAADIDDNAEINDAKTLINEEKDKYSGKPGETAANVVAVAANEIESGTAKDVKDAANAAVPPTKALLTVCINEAEAKAAADAVALATQAAVDGGETDPQTVAEAGRTEANKYTENTPAHTAADKVATAAEDEAGRVLDDPTAQSVADAASDKNQEIQGGNGHEDAKTAAEGVADAESTANTPDATPDDVAKAAEDAATEVTTNDNDKQDAANEVATAARTEADPQPPIAQSVADAAKSAVGGAVDTAAAEHVLYLEAAYEGSWGNSLRARVDYDVKDNDPALFNLTIRDGSTGQVEQFRNVSVDPARARRVDKVLSNQSQLVRVRAEPPMQTGRPAAHPDPQPGEDLWGDNDIITNSKADSTGNDGDQLVQDQFTGPGKEGAKEGLYALEKADLFNLLCIPNLPDTLAEIDGTLAINTGLIASSVAYCEKRRAMLIIDSPAGWGNKEDAKTGISQITTSKNAALFFPRLRQPDLLRGNQMGTFAPCGAVAGVFARTDAQRGIWKAPAGLEATLKGVSQLEVPLTDAENGELNPLGINCLRVLPAAGAVVWGTRTRQGDDRLASEWKYISVRRLALYIEESLYRGTQWAVFEPNDEPLWAQIRMNVGAFMRNLFRQGAFQGRSPKEAYFVKCDKETTTQNDINLGIVNVVVGFAPLKPAEFVMISLQQMAGQIQA